MNTLFIQAENQAQSFYKGNHMPNELIQRTLPLKREFIIKKVKAHIEFLRCNAEKLDIYEGNLLPYIDQIMRMSLSPQYYMAIKDRLLPINILQRYVDKVSVAYSKPPKRSSTDKTSQEFLDYYSKQLDINTSGMVADQFAAMFKGFAWEPYITDEGEPKLRELPFDRFLVISDSKVNPEEGNIFVKIIGDPNDKNGECLLFTYTNEEFDAFYMNMQTAYEYLAENDGVNQFETIPFVYGKRQKNKLIPTQDTDILAFTKSIPVMLSDAAGAQMFQCFTILYGIDLSFDNLKMSPNAFWNLKSDNATDKEPKVGTLTPSADTEKVIKFIITSFILFLETKGIRVGSIGSMDANSVASGISKIVDEMDVNNLVNKSMDWFEKDEHELWNKKLPKIHKYWVTTGLLDSKKAPIVDDPQITVSFERPEPTLPRSEEIKNAESELAMGTVEFEDILRTLHPEYDATKLKKLVDAYNAKRNAKVNADNNAQGDNNANNDGSNQNSQGPNQAAAGSNSSGHN
jgi:hypothetical protein